MNQKIAVPVQRQSGNRTTITDRFANEFIVAAVPELQHPVQRIVTNVDSGFGYGNAHGFLKSRRANRNGMPVTVERGIAILIEDEY